MEDRELVAQGTSSSLRRVITLRYAVAMYMTSVLGSGILIIPGLAAKIAGPGSLLAWFLLSLASYPFAYTFSRLSSRSPESGGIYAFAREAFGKQASAIVAWLFIGWVVFGAPAISLSAAAYLGYSVPLTRPETLIVAAAILMLAFAVNFRGIRLGGQVQLAIVVGVVAVLLIAVAGSVGSIRASNFSPALPGGITSIGTASALIIWSFLGYENVSNVAEEFKDPKRDFARSVTISVVAIATLYLLVEFAVVGTDAYTVGGGLTPFAVMMSRVLGSFGGIVVSVLAVVVIFGTVNAYTGGLARVVYAAAKDGAMPSFLAAVAKDSGVPRRALLALIFVDLVSLSCFYFLHLSVETGLLATSGAAVLTYVIGSAAGIRLLGPGRSRLLPVCSLCASAVLVPFLGLELVPGLVIVAAAYCVLRLLNQSSDSRGSAAAG